MTWLNFLQFSIQSMCAIINKTYVVSTNLVRLESKEFSEQIFSWRNVKNVTCNYYQTVFLDIFL